MMEETISKTALARKLLLDFWSDLSQHSIAEFTDYLQENDLADTLKVMVGGAPVSEDYAQAIGANYSADALEAVSLAESLMEQ